MTTVLIIVIAFFVVSLLLRVFTQYFFEKKWITYEIKEGNHFSELKGWFWKKIKINLEEDNVLDFRVVFTKSCLYDARKVGQHINKLYGVACGQHHENSVRIGWRCESRIYGRFSLWAYCYNNGKLSIELLANTYVDNIERLRIEVSKSEMTAKLIDDNNYPTSIAQHTEYLEQHRDCPKLGRYKLFPYFGGEAVAPHDMEIRIYEIE